MKEKCCEHSDKKNHLGFQMKMTSNMIKRKIDECIMESGDGLLDIEITGMQGWVIDYIQRRSQHGESVYQRDVEHEFNIRRSTATRILQILEQKAYITRVAVDNDARLKKIVLTQKALDANECIHSNIEKVDKLIEEDITPEEMETFFRVINKVRNNLK